MSYFAELVEKLSWDNESERRKAACRNLTTGLLIGAFVGVTAGILFAPKPGRETRKEISEKAADAVDQLREAVADFVSDLQERTEEAVSSEGEFEEIVDVVNDNQTES